MIPAVARFTIAHHSRSVTDVAEPYEWVCAVELPGYSPRDVLALGDTPEAALRRLLADLDAEPPVKRTDLPTTEDIVGIEPDLTGGLPAEEWLRQRRGGG